LIELAGKIQQKCEFLIRKSFAALLKGSDLRKGIFINKGIEQDYKSSGGGRYDKRLKDE